MSRAKCFSFYSYKGGSGRSTTAINTVKHLAVEMKASPEHPILLVDADLESAGLTYFFDCEKKFSDEFGALHTHKLLAEPQLYFESQQKRQRFFGTPLTRVLGDSDIMMGKIVKVCTDDAKELFADIQLSVEQTRFLEIILDSHIEFDSKKSTYEMDDKSRRIYKMFNNFLAFAKKLRNIQEDAQTEKAARKTALLSMYLPAAQFVDVSHFFGVEAGTIRFVGADVHYQGEQVARGGTDGAIDYLVDTVSDFGYRAVVFDSSAGSQSTAHALHSASDVLVYCMRPTRQFISGTRTQLFNYAPLMDGKRVIVLPTAVSLNQRIACLREDSFQGIQSAIKHSKFVDGYFCEYDKALCEVELFKWHEQILGAIDCHEMSDAARKISDQYASELTMDDDAKRAYNTYRELAARLVFNAAEIAGEV